MVKQAPMGEKKALSCPHFRPRVAFDPSYGFFGAQTDCGLLRFMHELAFRAQARTLMSGLNVNETSESARPEARAPPLPELPVPLAPWGGVASGGSADVLGDGAGALEPVAGAGDVGAAGVAAAVVDEREAGGPREDDEAAAARAPASDAADDRPGVEAIPPAGV